MEKFELTSGYAETTRDITVVVVPQYQERRSDPDNNVFSFAYTVTIENHGSETVQLLERHWIVASGGAPFNEVTGQGVVGEQPVLRPGEAFEYTSVCSIKDPIGSMFGTYTFRTESNEVFDVLIPKFELVQHSQNLLH